MDYLISYATDVGTCKSTNQDSICIKEAKTGQGTILLAVICDGMGGLERGEIASKSIIKAFSKWFSSQLPLTSRKEDRENEIVGQWHQLICGQNQNIANYGRENGIQLGSTLTAFLVLENGDYLIGHVGDTRVYRMTEAEIDILTEDHTLAAHEVRNGRLKANELENDPRQSVLLQCVGASKKVEPQFVKGKVTQDEAFLLCSDGFRHKVKKDEIWNECNPAAYRTENEMKAKLDKLLQWNMQREETDNITAILIKAEE